MSDPAREPLIAQRSTDIPQDCDVCYTNAGQKACFLADAKAVRSDRQYSRVQKKLIAACVLCFFFMIAEVVGGYIAHSVAIMADAAHMFSDVSSFAVSLFATWVVTQKSSSDYSYGYHRVEIIGALLSVLIIWAVTGALVFEAVQRVVNPVAVDGKVMFIVATAGIVFNLLVMLVLGHAHGPGGCSGHGHEHGHGDGHEHEHGHDAGGAHGHAHAHKHERRHSHSHDGEDDRVGCNHDHDHDHAEHAHDHKHYHEHTHDHEHGSVHEHGHGHEHAHDHDHEHDHEHSSHDESGSSAARDVVIQIPIAPVASPFASAAHAHAETRSKAHHAHDHGHDHDHDHDHSNLNMRGAVLHVIGDLVQSVGVALAGLLIWYKQDDARWALADPICTFLFAILVLFTTRALLRDIFDTLMERTPQCMDLGAVNNAIMEVPGVGDVHDLHVWNISTGVPVLTAHVTVLADASPDDVLRACGRNLRGLGISHSTVQICNPGAQLAASPSLGAVAQRPADPTFGSARARACC